MNNHSSRLFSPDYREQPFWWERTPRPVGAPAPLPASVDVLVIGEFDLACSVVDMDVDLSMGASAGARIGVLPKCGIEVLADVSAKVFEVVTALNFPM